MPQRKRISFKALLPLGLLAMAAAIFGRKPDEWEYETVDEVVEPIAPAAERPAARRHPAKHFALAAAFTTLFFAGAAFTAGAGDRMVRFAEEDEAALQASTSDLSSPTATEVELAPEPAAPEATPEASAEPVAADAAPADAAPAEAPAAEAAPGPAGGVEDFPRDQAGRADEEVGRQARVGPAGEGAGGRDRPRR